MMQERLNRVFPSPVITKEGGLSLPIYKNRLHFYDGTNKLLKFISPVTTDDEVPKLYFFNDDMSVSYSGPLEGAPKPNPLPTLLWAELITNVVAEIGVELKLEGYFGEGYCAARLEESEAKAILLAQALKLPYHPKDLVTGLGVYGGVEGKPVREGGSPLSSAMGGTSTGFIVRVDRWVRQFLDSQPA